MYFFYNLLEKVHILISFTQYVKECKHLHLLDMSRLKPVLYFREVCEKALEDYYFTNASEEAGDGSKENDLSHQLEYLHEVFDKAEKADKPSDVSQLLIFFRMMFFALSFLPITVIIIVDIQVPDHLCCKIMLNIFHDPVITPSGITYEKAALLKHLNTVIPNLFQYSSFLLVLYVHAFKF